METVIVDVLRCLYKYTAQSLIFAIMASLLLYCMKREDVKKILSGWFDEMINCKRKLWEWAFFFYCYIMFLRTILDRKTVVDATKKVLEGWKVYVTADGTTSYEALENCILFIPLIFLLCQAFGDKILKKEKFSNLLNMIMLSFGVSMFIELNQLFFKLGSFQISDLVYNTVSGLMGYLLWGFKELCFTKKISDGDGL